MSPQSRTESEGDRRDPVMISIVETALSSMLLLQTENGLSLLS
jgi:hypothetical protein